MATHIWVKS
jgi:hypothetical protein